ERLIVGSITKEGQFNGRYEESGFGGRQYSLRSAFENPLDSTQRTKAATAIAQGVFDKAEGDSLIGFTGKDLAATPHMSVVVKRGQAASMAGTNAILTNPLGTMAGFGAAAKELEDAGTRRFPIDATKLFGFGETHMEIRLMLPDGWKAQLPPNVSAASPFGQY